MTADGPSPAVREPAPAAVRLRAHAVHVLTASGAVVALLALLAAADGAWPRMFGWLGVALVFDGLDGPLARRVDTRANAPVLDGVILDLVVDYLSYVLVPVFALLRAGMLEGPAGTTTALLVAAASAVYFADTRMKTPDRSFNGFPACWNLVALVLLVLRPGRGLALAVVLGLTVLMFAPLRFIHPVRTRRWRPLSMTLLVAWLALAGAAASADLTLAPVGEATLLALSLVLLAIGPLQQAVAPAMIEPGRVSARAAVAAAGSRTRVVLAGIRPRRPRRARRTARAPRPPVGRRGPRAG